MLKRLVLCLCSMPLLLGCVNAAYNRAEVRDDRAERVTIATVQREIRPGMSSAEVASVLGSPNLVTTDANRCENWVYDKVATETAYSHSTGRGSGGLGGAAGGADGGLLGALGFGGGKSAGAVATNQRTMTIIIKFDKDNRVRDYSYRQSSF